MKADRRSILRRWNCPVFMVAILTLQSASAVRAGDGPQLFTHQSYVEETMRPPQLPLGNIKAMFGWVLGSLPDRVKVYPTENYYYFRFIHNGVSYAGNIRLDASDRDDGKVHFAYFEDMEEYRVAPLILYRNLDKAAGVTVEKIDRLLYRVSYEDKSVLFELNDLSKVTPPPNAINAEEIYIGPIFDDSAIRFFLVFNSRLKIFHYILDETVQVHEEFLKSRLTDRILIGKRTGFAFYRDAKLDRKILIGVFASNAAVNNYFDGPFDQLPDNFIEGDLLQKALIASDPYLEGTIDRLGHFADRSGRYAITPYAYYRTEEDLSPLHSCATDTRIPSADYYACFVLDWNVENWMTAPREIRAVKLMAAAEKPPKTAQALHKKTSKQSQRANGRVQ